jgi:hypothetical protein
MDGELLSLVYSLLCAVVYFAILAVLLWRNPRNSVAWRVSAAAAISWPGLFLFGAQLLFIVPLLTIFAIDGTQLKKNISRKAAAWAIVVCVVMLAVLIGIGFLIEG